MDFADEHPSANVVGIDLSPIQPKNGPPNCQFRVDDAELEWTERGQYDFIHSRAMVIDFRSWPKYFQQAYASLKPGGIIECQDPFTPIVEVDKTGKDLIESNSMVVEWSRRMNEAGTKLGMKTDAPVSLYPCKYPRQSSMGTDCMPPLTKEALCRLVERGRIQRHTHQVVQVAPGC